MAAPKPRTVVNPLYTAKSYKPEESLGFLLGRCLNRIKDAIDAALAAVDLNSQQFGVLHAILRGKASNPSELARLRYQNSASITYILDSLEAKELVARKRSAQDRRVVELELTDKGAALTRSCIPLVVNAQNDVLADLSPKDYETLTGLLRRVAR